jgi:putative DNA primase/helicase
VTRVFCERATAIFNGLPIILDDTKTVSDEKLGVSIIYDLVAGIGRGRGSIKGLCQTSSWRSVLISSGENPVTAFSRDGGTRARTLSLWGSPFGQRDEATAKVVQEMDQAIKKNFGHAGPKFVEYLIENRDQWDEYRQAFQNLQDGYLERAAGDPVAGRMAAYFAVITLAAQLAHEALDLPWLYEDPVLPLWDELTAGTDEADPPKKALEHVQAWAIGHERSFYGRHDSDSLGRARSPAGGWAGRWDSRDDWQHIDFVRPRLDLLLGQAGFDPEAVRRSWMERGWLARDGDGKGTITARIGKQLLRLVRVKRAAWEELYVPEGVTYQNAQFLV